VFEQGEIDSIAGWITLAEGARDFPRLPIDDAGEDQRQTTASVHLFPQLTGIDSTAPAVEHVSSQGVKLFDFE